ncbi:hypothetical protein QYE76_043604 [Lolium multiflorum]|uniref:RING-type domain-containing protein n=1 Tax=Lolium multiflorum TaxID=4521 RepID=A0AAD8WY22_LOLMU|nr:hypothetical protein QYE76_043604 [Lolium multiflorum]
MAQVAAGNGSHVIDIDADDSAERMDQPPLPDQLAATANNHCHVIDVVTVDTTAARPPELHECAVCMERLMWVAVGPCGHHEVCSKCAVRIRSVDSNRLCCICRAPCPAVLVTRRSRTSGDGKLIYSDELSSLALAADEGPVGNYWYHKASAAYFDDERQYNEAQRACSEIQRAEAGDEQDEDDHEERSSVCLLIVYEQSKHSNTFLIGSRSWHALATARTWLEDLRDDARCQGPLSGLGSLPALRVA